MKYPNTNAATQITLFVTEKYARGKRFNIHHSFWLIVVHVHIQYMRWGIFLGYSVKHAPHCFIDI